MSGDDDAMMTESEAIGLGETPLKAKKSKKSKKEKKESKKKDKKASRKKNLSPSRVEEEQIHSDASSRRAGKKRSHRHNGTIEFEESSNKARKAVKTSSPIAREEVNHSVGDSNLVSLIISDDDDDQKSNSGDSNVDLGSSRHDLELQEIETDVRFRVPESDSSQVLITTFPQATAENLKNLNFGLFQRNSRKNRPERIVYTETDAVEYEAHNFGNGNDAVGKLDRFLIFRYSPDSNEAVLLNNSVASQFPLQLMSRVRTLPDPPVHSVELDEKHSDGSNEVIDAEESRANAAELYKKRQDALMENFGSRKSKSSYLNSDANRVDANSMVSSASVKKILIEQGVKFDSAKEPENSVVEQNRRLLLPTYHLGATKAKDVYILKEIVTEDERQVVKDQVIKLGRLVEAGVEKIDEAVAAGAVCHFVGEMLSALVGDIKQGNCSTKETKKAVFTLTCMNNLALLYRLPKVLSPNHFKTLENSLGENLSRYLVSNFAFMEEAIWTKSAHLVDKLVLRFLVLVLIMDKFCVSSSHVDILAKNFRKPRSWVLDYFAQLGCRVTRGSNKAGAGEKSVILEVPLKFPALKKIGK